MRHNFPYNLRLHNSAQFKHVFTQAQKVTAGRFRIFYCANNLTIPRLGVVVTKKNIAAAVKRNVFKRIARESFRYNSQQLQGFDYVVFAYKEAMHISKKELRQCLNQQWEKLATMGKK